MQRARDPEGKGANPVRVFLILAAVLVAIGAAIWLTRPDNSSTEAATPAADTPPDFSLTDEEAIARFEELDALRISALRSRDDSLLDEVFVVGGPAYRRVSKTLRTLRKEQTLYRSGSSTESIEVTSNASSAVEVEQVALIDPRFINESGEDVTAGRQERQTVVWEMRLEGDRWLLFDGVLTDVEKL